MAKSCAICGKPSGMYPLCVSCFKLRDEGKIEKCEECGIWHYTDGPCECKKTSTNETTSFCIVCGENSNGKPQCRNCYNESRDFMKELNKNNTIADFREHYYNLKDSIYRTKDFETVKSMCNRLFAIAELNKTSNNDNALISKVQTDIIEIIKLKKPPQKTTELSQDTLRRDLYKSEKKRALDGHYVESDAEMQIDDLLYAYGIFHCYGKAITGISEKPKKCDWFIPCSDGIRKGIYIEYWGMETPKYIKDRQEKEEYYQKNNIPYISIEKDEIHGDSQGLIERITRELNRKAEEYFGIKNKFS